MDKYIIVTTTITEIYKQKNELNCDITNIEEFFEKNIEEFDKLKEKSSKTINHITKDIETKIPSHKKIPFIDHVQIRESIKENIFRNNLEEFKLTLSKNLNNLKKIDFTILLHTSIVRQKIDFIQNFLELTNNHFKKEDVYECVLKFGFTKEGDDAIFLEKTNLIKYI